MRSDKQWDEDAKALQALRTGPDLTPTEPDMTEAEAAAIFKDLKDQVQAYKDDDPASGPEGGFPDIDMTPRRN